MSGKLRKAEAGGRNLGRLRGVFQTERQFQDGGLPGELAKPNRYDKRRAAAQARKAQRRKKP